MKPFVADLHPGDAEAENLEPFRIRAEIVEGLRRVLPRLEGRAGREPAFSFGLAGLDAHLPQGGLSCGALHEILPAGEGDLPAAFAFLAALFGRMPGEAPLLLVVSRRG